MYEVRLMTKSEFDKAIRQRFKELMDHVGTPRQMHVMLEVSLSTATLWRNGGYISRDGAKLVGKHPTLGKLFKAEYLRPDLVLEEGYEDSDELEDDLDIVNR